MSTRGFSLIEVAIVLVIISVLVAIVAVPLATQLEQQRITETNKQLEIIKEALIGFTLANGRLPCPAGSNSAGQESFCTNASAACGAPISVLPAHGRCSSTNGFIPAAALGLSPVDSQGYMVDAFVKADVFNRLRYAVPDATLFDVNPTTFPVGNLKKDYRVFTSVDGMRNATMDKITAYSAVAGQGFLYACQEDAAVTTVASANCAPRNELTRGTPAVIFSVASNSEVALANLTSGGEKSNQTPDSKVFFQGTRVDNRNGATPYYFDDLVTWISPNTLFARMVLVGKLP